MKQGQNGLPIVVITSLNIEAGRWNRGKPSNTRCWEAGCGTFRPSLWPDNNNLGKKDVPTQQTHCQTTSYFTVQRQTGRDGAFFYKRHTPENRPQYGEGFDLLFLQQRQQNHCSWESPHLLGSLVSNHSVLMIQDRAVHCPKTFPSLLVLNDGGVYGFQHKSVLHQLSLVLQK